MSEQHKKHDVEQIGEGADPGKWGSGYMVGMNLVVSVIVGSAMGVGLDYVFGTKPLFLLLMMLFGFIAGLREIWVMIQDTDKKDDNKSDVK